MMQIHCIYINVKLESKMNRDRRKPKTCVNQIGYSERKLGFMVYKMKWWWKKVGVSLKFESKNHPISLRHANSLSVTNFSASRNCLKKSTLAPFAGPWYRCLVLVQFLFLVHNSSFLVPWPWCSPQDPLFLYKITY